MFYILNFENHSFTSEDTEKAVRKKLLALVAQGFDESDIEIINAMVDDIRYSVEEFINSFFPTEATEVCPYCETENTYPNYDAKTSGYVAICRNCGKEIFLCDECCHADDNLGRRCDNSENGNSCFRGNKKRVDTSGNNQQMMDMMAAVNDLVAFEEGTSNQYPFEVTCAHLKHNPIILKDIAGFILSTVGNTASTDEIYRAIQSFSYPSFFKETFGTIDCAVRAGYSCYLQKENGLHYYIKEREGNVEWSKVFPRREAELHEMVLRKDSSFYFFAESRAEAYRKYMEFEKGFNDPDTTASILSYTDFCTELNKGYQGSSHNEVGRLAEVNGLIYYDELYAGGLF